jgi:leucyl aminopeptidase
MDITDTGDLGAFTRLAATGKGTEKGRGTFPTTPACNDTVAPLLKQLSKKNMRKHLETFTSFFTRYYKSRTGAQASSWLLGQVSEIVQASGAGQHGASVKAFQHPWGQDSIIATIPGRSAKTVVIGAHLDSINLFLPSLFAAPGADDDGSGTVTTLEAFRVLLTRGEIVHGNASNTIEFHWYSAEEGGLLGSQAIFSAYEREGRDVKAMLQQDMTGYVHKTIAAGEPESVGIITDYVDPGLTDFIKQIVTYVRGSTSRRVVPA